MHTPAPQLLFVSILIIVVSLFVCLSACLSACLPVRLFVRLFVHTSVCVSPLRLSINFYFDRLSGRLSLFLSVSVSVCLPVYSRQSLSVFVCYESVPELLSGLAKSPVSITSVQVYWSRHTATQSNSFHLKSISEGIPEEVMTPVAPRLRVIAPDRKRPFTAAARCVFKCADQ